MPDIESVKRIQPNFSLIVLKTFASVLKINIYNKYLKRI
jgi:hypothetical protein